MSFTRSFEHKDALAAAALVEFSTRGYAKASLNRILVQSGMSKGQFYHHFAGKEGLYLALVELLIARKTAHFEAHPVAVEGDFFGSLRAQLRAGVAFSRAHPEIDRFARSFLRERGNPIFRTVLRRFAFDEHSALGALVDRFHGEGRFHSSLSRDFVLRAVTMVFNQVTELLDLRGPEDLEARVDELVEFLRRGLSSR